MSDQEKQGMGFAIQQSVALASSNKATCDISAFKSIGAADETALAAACGTNPCSTQCKQLCRPFGHCANCKPCIEAKWEDALSPAQYCAGYTKFCATSIGCDTTQLIDIQSKLPGKMAVFDGKGKEFAPCELDTKLLNTHASKAAKLPLCKSPHFYLMDPTSIASLGQCMASLADKKCDPKTHIGELIAEDSCSLCNAQHCKCASTQSGDAKESILANMAHNKRARANIGKEVWAL